MPDNENEEKYQPRNTVKDLNAEARVYIAEAMGDLGKLKGYLDVMARYPDYSPMNCAHIAMHRPQAAQLWSADAIKEAGGYINRSEKGVPIVYPRFVPGKDGEPGKTYHNVKYMFARDQQHGAKLEHPKAYDQRVVIDAMSKVDTCQAPASREGLYVVGQHFGIEGVYIDKLPELPQTDDLETALAAARDYMESVHAEVKPFVYALERKCAELVADKTVSRNERVAQMFSRAAKKEAPQQAAEERQAEAPASVEGIKEEKQAAKPTSAKARMEAAKLAAAQRSQAPSEQQAKTQQQAKATATR